MDLVHDWQSSKEGCVVAVVVVVVVAEFSTDREEVRSMLYIPGELHTFLHTYQHHE